MRAMVLEECGPVVPDRLKWIEVPDPAPGEGEIRIRVEACGVCRTDLHVIEGELPSKKHPLIPGHQAVGRVDAVGRGVTRFRVGSRVGIAWLRRTCGSCAYCAAGQENLCEDSRFTGWDADGGFAELAVAPADFAYALPDGIEAENAAPLLCSGIIGYRAYRRAELPPRGTLGLFGFGGSAHLVLQLARAEGARVFVVTRGEGHRRLAQEMGADWAGKSAYDLPRKLDSAILFAPAGDWVPIALQSLKKGGTLAVAGIVLSPVPALEYEKNLFFEKTLRSVTSNTRRDGEEFLKKAAEYQIRPQVTTYSLREANQALLDLKADRINGSAVIVF